MTIFVLKTVNFFQDKTFHSLTIMLGPFELLTFNLIESACFNVIQILMKRILQFDDGPHREGE